MKDKTNNKALENRVRLITQSINDTQFHSKIGSWNWNVVTNEVTWSEYMFVLLGLEPNEQEPSYELALHHVHDSDKERYQKVLETALTNKTPYYLENKISKKDKSVIPVISRGRCVIDEKGVLIRMFGTVQDVSFQKELEKIKQEKILAEERTKYTQTIFNNIGDAVYVKDNQSRLVFVNNAFCEMFDLPRDKIIGNTLTEDVTPEEREIFLKIDKQVLADGVENISAEPLNVRGRQTRIISARISRFIDQSGNKFLVGSIRDISEQKKEEQKLRESEKKFRALNATKDKLFSIIAHDLRSPFQSFIGLSEILLDSIKTLDTTNAEKYVVLINSSAENTLNLLGNLLRWAESQTGYITYKSEKFDATAFVTQALENAKSLAKTKNISLTQNQLEHLEIDTDENMLSIILRNLISNALKFTVTGGNVHVSTTQKQHHIEFSVSDNGIGINQEKQKKLFDMSTNKSSRGTENEKGFGLGLVLCKEFVEKLGGEIWVKSVEGKGSDFIFSVPLKTTS